MLKIAAFRPIRLGVVMSRALRRPAEQAQRGGLLPPRSEAEIVLYDFRRPTKLARDHVRVLQMSYETFARRLGTLLTSTLRAVCQVNLLAIEQQTYEEYISGLDTPTLLAPTSIKPMPGTGVFEMSVTTALACIDHLLGGPGGTQPNRPLTDIENTLVRDIVDQVFGVLRYGLEPIVGIETELGPLEFNPPFLQAAGATDMMVVGSFEIRVGNEIGLATLCLPFASIFPRLQAKGAQRALSPGEQRSAELSAREMRESLGEVPVEVSIRFDPVRLPPLLIADLAPGDVVPLAHRVTAPLSVQCGGITLTHAIAGREGSRLAGLVVDKNLESTP